MFVWAETPKSVMHTGAGVLQHLVEPAFVLFPPSNSTYILAHYELLTLDEWAKVTVIILC